MRQKLLKNYTQFRLGGIAYIKSAADTDELISVLKDLTRKNMKFFILGGGTNIIASDKGYSGIVLHIKTNAIQKNRNTILCDAGVPLARLIRFANSQGFQGLETLAGIPGTVGGAVFGNAGAYGNEIANVVKKIYVFDGRQARWIVKNKNMFGYRDSIFKRRPWVILQILFSFTKDHLIFPDKTRGKSLEARKKTLQKISRDIIALRLKKYKPGLRCAGSIFKNIPASSPLGKKLIKNIPADKMKGGKIPAGYLLESVGAKGMRIGGIAVANHHGNLLINNGRGKASEAKKLIDILKNRVHKKYGVWLEEEVRYLGF